MKVFRSCRTHGFSLVELLAVLAIFGVLAAVSVRSLPPVGQSGHINTGVVRVMNALAQARSEAIARNTGVQLRVVSRAPRDEAAAGRVFSLWARKKDGTADYEQLTPWDRLPDVVALIPDAPWFDALKSGQATLQGENPFASPVSLPGIGYRGESVDVHVLEFGPNGGIRLPKPSQTYSYLLLAGTVPGAAGEFSSRSQEVWNTKNWRQIRISNLTGQMRVNVPQL
jgi:type II secretion system protein H